MTKVKALVDKQTDKLKTYMPRISDYRVIKKINPTYLPYSEKYAIRTTKGGGGAGVIKTQTPLPHRARQQHCINLLLLTD